LDVLGRKPPAFFSMGQTGLAIDTATAN